MTNIKYLWYNTCFENDYISQTIIVCITKRVDFRFYLEVTSFIILTEVCRTLETGFFTLFRISRWGSVCSTSRLLSVCYEVEFFSSIWKITKIQTYSFTSRSSFAMDSLVFEIDIDTLTKQLNLCIQFHKISTDLRDFSNTGKFRIISFAVLLLKSFERCRLGTSGSDTRGRLVLTIDKLS